MSWSDGPIGCSFFALLPPSSGDRKAVPIHYRYESGLSYGSGRADGSPGTQLGCAGAQNSSGLSAEQFALDTESQWVAVLDHVCGGTTPAANSGLLQYRRLQRACSAQSTM